MSIKVRKDSWSVDDDNLLKEIVLKKIEQGHSQVSGFEEASTLLNRTKQACAFRWNKNLRPTIFPRETPQKESPMSNSAEPSSIQNHLESAMKSYVEMQQSFFQISQEYNLLKRDYEVLVNWIKQGNAHID